ncbi:2-hydroxyacyl-CoA lyase 2-like [Panonychus citri]|uniref:2-hydroxyacyl-CoA lyase 2-like n=1 Tax=Panonychus citri TaxID=50023 RepID=UPI0023072491|nr:2-hydroxyacyl-CoA lyase 2-like [Panonychus citri]XP_053212925.1 2-hydroxyacyl-CoA lyase 2-like [Panonychus citri]
MALRRLSVFSSYFTKIDENSARHGGELIAQTIHSHGVEHIFTLSGGHISPILTAAEKLGIRILDTRHEVNAVFAADAVARISGKPGVAVVTAGPGITNTITGIKNAQMAESPVVLFGGCPATLLKGKGALQDIDQMSLMKSVTKWQKTITRVRDIVPIVREAFQVAQSGTPGPVFVECPLDILYPYKMVSREMSAKSKSNDLMSKLTNGYLNLYAKDLFAGAFDQQWPTDPLPISFPTPSEGDISRVISLLQGAKRPLILLGSQSVLPPIGAHKLKQNIESLGIPCFLGGMSRGLLGRKSPIQMRQSRRDALKEADLIILGGIVTDFRLSYGRVLPKSAKIVAINRSKEQLYKNHGIFWNSEVAIEGDVGSFFDGLADELKSKNFTVDQGWIKALRERDDSKESKTSTMAEAPTDQHLNPIKLLTELENVIPENSILIADGGDFVGSASYIVRPRGPLCWLDPGAFGTLGCGGGFALGAKAVKPDADVIILYGDGSLGYSMIEYDSFVRHKLPVISVVGNDACWTQIAREQKPILGSDVSCNLAYTNYEKCVDGLGGKGFLLDASNGDNMKAVLTAAIQLARQGSPTLVNVLIGKTKFREGSLSV